MGRQSAPEHQDMWSSFQFIAWEAIRAVVQMLILATVLYGVIRLAQRTRHAQILPELGMQTAPMTILLDTRSLDMENTDVETVLIHRPLNVMLDRVTCDPPTDGVMRSNESMGRTPKENLL